MCVCILFDRFLLKRLRSEMDQVILRLGFGGNEVYNPPGLSMQ